MEELIKIQKSEGGKDVVSAMDLYEFLNPSTRFNDWIVRMLEYGFEENKDYSKLSTVVNQLITKIDYVLTIDTAKEISMLQRTEKGKQARRYFIACENRLREITKFQLPSTFSEALRLAADQHEEIEKQKNQIKNQSDTIHQYMGIVSDMRPKAVAAEILLLSEDAVTIGQFAKTIGTGQNRMFDLLRNDKFLIPDGSKRNLPYQKYIEQGLFEVREVTKTADNKIKLFAQTTITPKGQIYLSNKYNQQPQLS